MCVCSAQVLLCTNKMAGALNGNLNYGVLEMRRVHIVAIRWGHPCLSHAACDKFTAAKLQHRSDRRSTPFRGVVFHPEEKVA